MHTQECARPPSSEMRLPVLRRALASLLTNPRPLHMHTGRDGRSHGCSRGPSASGSCMLLRTAAAAALQRRGVLFQRGAVAGWPSSCVVPSMAPKEKQRGAGQQPRSAHYSSSVRVCACSSTSDGRCCWGGGCVRLPLLLHMCVHSAHPHSSPTPHTDSECGQRECRAVCAAAPGAPALPLQRRRGHPAPLYRAQDEAEKGLCGLCLSDRGF